MTAFEHVLTLLSFVYALALAHLLARVGELIVARRRVAFSGLLALAMLNIALLVVANWIALWDLRTAASWDIGAIALQLLGAVVMYLVCVVAGPRVPDEGPFDMGAYFAEQRALFYGGMVALILLAMAGNMQFLRTNKVSYFLEENAVCLVELAIAVPALVFRGRAVQWICGAALAVSTIVFTVFFDYTLH